MELLFSTIFEFIRRLTFMHLVFAPDRGVRVRGGKRVKEVGPGIWFSWPVLDRFEIVNPTTQTTPTTKQLIRRPDGVQTQIEMSITYSIENVTSYIMNVQDPDETLADRAKGFAVHAICDGVEDPRELSTRVGVELHQLARRPWGIKVDAVTVTTLCRPLPLYVGLDS